MNWGQKALELATTKELLARIRSLEQQLRDARESFAHSTRENEADLRRRSQVFNVVLSTLPDLICTFDLDGRFTYANPALLEVWRKPLAEIIGKNTYDLGYPRNLAARIQHEVQTVIATKRRVKNFTPFTGGDDETRVYEYIFSPVLNGDDSLEQVTCTARDVTEREQMQKALAESERKLQQIFSQAPVAIVVFRGRDFVVELANEPYRALIHGRELVGRRFRDVVPELGQDVWEAFNRVMDTGEPFIANDFYVPYDAQGNGTLEDHWFNVVYHPLRQPDGSISGLIAVLTLVTAQVLARKELERVNKELEEFAYVASHDLQEPLRMINIYSQLLTQRYSAGDAEAQEFAAVIGRGVSRMDGLIRDLLTYSRAVQSGESPLGSAKLSESLNDALAVLQNRIEESKAKVIAQELPWVRGDKAQLSQVFQNLLSNALKYGRKQVAPEIHITAERKGEDWIVAIRDNGIGFEPQYAERIFGLFKRLHKDEYPGTGLGLAICQHIIERHQGRMWAESALGEGSTFYFQLPGRVALSTLEGGER